MARHVVKAGVLAAIFALLNVGAAFADAGGQGTITATRQYRDLALFSQPVPNPCNGAPGTITATANTAFEHVTYFTTGPELWFTSTAEGTVTFTPDDSQGVSASGHFTEWVGDDFNNRNEVHSNTSTFNLRGSDGSHIVVHETFHVGTNANGVVTAVFDKLDVRCG
jgi:hypothetical protein